MAPRGKAAAQAAAAHTAATATGAASVVSEVILGGAAAGVVAGAAPSEAGARERIASSAVSVAPTATQVVSGDSAGGVGGHGDLCAGQTSHAGVCAGQCFFECGTTVGLYNIGTARCPKLTCGLCNSSRKAIESQARQSHQLKMVVDNMKRNQQAKYKAQVRAGRLVPGGQTSGERAAQLAEYAQELEISASVSDNMEILWPNKTEYIAYRKHWHRMTDDEASAAFDADEANPNIVKRGSTDDPRIPIAGIPRTVGSVNRSVLRRVSASSAIMDQAELNTASARMTVSALPQMGSADFRDVGGVHFRPGAASGSTTALSAGSAVERAAPAPIDFRELESVSVVQRAAPSRTLQARASDSGVDPRTAFTACMLWCAWC